MPPKETDPRLLRALRAVGRGRHSELYVWMRHHHARLKSQFEQTGPSWPALVVVFAEEGLTDGEGNPPTIRTAQQTWYRVCREVEQRRQGQKAAPTRRQTRQQVEPNDPEGSTLPDEPQHPSGIAPEVRLERLAALAAARSVPTGPRRALKTATLGNTAAAATEAGEGSVALPRPSMPKPRLIHHHAGKPDADGE